MGTLPSTLRREDTSLSVYCGKGRTERYRFRTTIGDVQKHVAEALQRLGVSPEQSSDAVQRIETADYATGFRFEELDETPGLGSLDQEPHPDGRRIAVYITYYSETIENAIAKTTGEMQDAETLFHPEEEEGQVPQITNIEAWRRSA